MCPYVFFYPSRFPVGYRKVFAYLNANVVKVFKDARDDGVKKLHPPLGEDVIGNGLYQFT
jgi:hypothetical protein